MILSMQEKKAKLITCKGRTITLNPRFSCTKVSITIITGKQLDRISIGQAEFSE